MQSRSILYRVRTLGFLVDKNVPGAKDQLRGAILRLRRVNPYRLQLPLPLKRREAGDDAE